MKRTRNPPKQSRGFQQKPHTHTHAHAHFCPSVCLPEGSYLLVGVRPVKAQEEVGGLAVEEEISRPERNGEAMNSTAEVKGDPEVLGVGIYKDVLQDRTGNVRAASGQSHLTGPQTMGE